VKLEKPVQPVKQVQLDTLVKPALPERQVPLVEQEQPVLLVRLEKPALLATLVKPALLAQPELLVRLALLATLVQPVSQE
jgi:hypothetical protein